MTKAFMNFFIIFSLCSLSNITNSSPNRDYLKTIKAEDDKPAQTKETLTQQRVTNKSGPEIKSKENTNENNALIWDWLKLCSPIIGFTTALGFLVLLTEQSPKNKLS